VSASSPAGSSGVGSFHVTVVPDEREEALVRGLLWVFEAFGGVPLVTVWDNPKTVVLTRKDELIVWNPVFGQVALDYGSRPSCAGPAPGSRKAPSKTSWAG
jgi:transposase